MSPTERALQDAHSDLCSVTGRIALTLAKGRGLGRKDLADMITKIRRAAECLETILGE